MSSEEDAAVARIREQSLKKTFWVIITRAVAGQEKIRALIPAHLKHQIALEKQGILFGAGPLSDEADGHTGTGMIIIHAGDAAEARRIAESDPLHRAGLRSFTLQQWSMNEGRLQITLDVSDGSARLA